MALSLGVSIGSKISVGPSTVKVDDIIGGTQLRLDVDGTKWTVDDQQRTEILPDVFVQCGLSKANRGGKMSRLAFEAPLHIKINRVQKDA